jgi:hypothetical protein
MTQGDLSTNEFCQKMKAITDALRDIGHTIVNSQLVLKPHFSSTSDNISLANEGKVTS